MTSMPYAPGLSRATGRADAACVQVAVGALRALAGPADGMRGVGLPPTCAYLARAGSAFRAFRLAARLEPGARPACMAASSGAALTKDERRLVRALAAAQAGDAPLLDNYLYKLALHRDCRACLAEGVCSLATALSNAGYRVPMLQGAQASSAG